MSNVNLPNCEDIRPLLSAKIDGELNTDELAAVESHLARCAECQRQLEMFAAVDEYVQTRIELSSDFPIRTVRPASHVQSRRRLHWRRAVLALAGVMLLAVAFPYFRNPPAIQADDLIQPLVALERISERENAARQSMYKMVELDLRALKLEVQEADLDGDTEAALVTRIDALTSQFEAMSSIANFESEANALFLGE